MSWGYIQRGKYGAAYARPFTRGSRLGRRAAIIGNRRRARIRLMRMGGANARNLAANIIGRFARRFRR